MSCFSFKSSLFRYLLLCSLYWGASGGLQAQDVIFDESFSDYPDGTESGSRDRGRWWTSAKDCDDGSYNTGGSQWGVFDQEFLANDIDGDCCSSSMAGDGENYLYFTVDISSYCSVSFSLDVKSRAPDNLECFFPDDPVNDCTELTPLNNSHDQVYIEFNVDDNPFVNLAYICGKQGLDSKYGASNLNGDSLRIKIKISNRDEDDFYQIDDVLVTGDLKSPPNLKSPPDNLCLANGLYDLQQLEDPAIPGSWSGPGVSDSSFDPGAFVGQTAVIYFQPDPRFCAFSDSVSINVNEQPIIEAIPDTTVCDYFVLPPIEGQYLTGRQFYFTDVNGVGKSFLEGDTIRESGFYAAFDEHSECGSTQESFQLTVLKTPDIVNPGSIVVCESFVFPGIKGENLSGSQAYYELPNGQGDRYLPGDSLSANSLFYIYDEQPGCNFDQESFHIEIKPAPELVKPEAVLNCGPYTLPPIEGQNLSGGEAYYFQSEGRGPALAAGSVIGRTDTLYLYDVVGECYDQDTLYIAIDPDIQFDTIEDQSACVSFILPQILGRNLSGRQSYFSGPGGTGEQLFPGAIITSSQRLYLYDSAGSCSDEISFFVTINERPQVTYRTLNITCNGEADGAIGLNINGAAPFDVDWSVDSLDGLLNPSGLAAGAYFLTVTDDNQCDTSFSITLFQPPPLNLECSVLQATITPNGTGGVAGLRVEGGDGGPYQLDWDGPRSGSASDLEEGLHEVRGLSRGEYSVTLTDSAGCTTTCNFVVTGPPCDLALEVREESVLCYGDLEGSISLSVSTSFPPYQIAWSDPNLPAEDTLTQLPAGLYEVSVTDAIQCLVKADIKIVSPDSITLIANQISFPSLVGGTDAKASLLVSGGLPPYQLNWIGPTNGDLALLQAETVTLTDLAAGDYYIQATDANNCAKEFLLTIEDPPCNLLLFMFEQSPVLCHGESNAAINLGANNGVRPYSYDWSGPTSVGNIEDPKGLSAGTYTVTVTDAIGCADSSSIRLAEPSPLQLNCRQLSAVSDYGEADGKARLNFSGGTEPYGFVWKGSAHSLGVLERNIPGEATLNELEIGQYDLTLTDGRGCEEICNFVIEPPDCKLSLNISQRDVSCPGETDGFLSVDIQNGFPPFHIDWDRNEFDGTSILRNLETGDYALTLVDSLGCVADTLISIVAPEEIILSCAQGRETSGLNASDGQGFFEISGGAPPYLLTWSGATSGQMNISNPGNGEIFDLPAGEYLLQATDANNCVQSCTFVVNDPICADFSIGLSSQAPTCLDTNDGQIQLNINDKPDGFPHTIDWGIDSVNNLTILENLAASNYSVTVTNTQNCILTNTISLERTAPLLLNCGTLADSMHIAKIIFEGGLPPYQLNWTGPSSDSRQFPSPDSILLRDLTPGNYQVILTDDAACIQSCNFTISEPDCSAFSIQLEGINPTCNNGNDGQINLLINDESNGRPHTVEWEQSSFNGLQNISGLNAETFSVSVTNAKGCVLTESITLNAPEALSLSCREERPANPNSSNDGAARINFLGGTPPYRLSWKGPVSDEQTADEAAEFLLNQLPSGKYDVRLVDAHGCETVCEFAINRLNCDLQVDAETGDISCPGEADGFIELIPRGGFGSLNADWSIDAFDGLLSADGLSAGTYSVLVQDSLGCQADATIFIETPSMLSVLVETQGPRCADKPEGSIMITSVSGGTPPYRVSINKGSSIPIPSLPFTLPNLPIGSYTLTIFDASDCSIQETAELFTASPLRLQLAEDKTINRGDSASIEVLDINFSPAAIRWTPENSVYPPDAIATIAFPKRTTTYTLELTDASGCIISDEINIEVKDARGVYIPNAFRPESSSNNRFTVFGGAQVEMVGFMRIFDRWGNFIFEQKDFLPNNPLSGWDGSIRSQKASVGVYVYAVEIIYSDGEKEVLYGEVNLIP